MAEEKKLPVLPDDEIERRLASELPGWWYEGRWIRRKYNTDGWLTTLALVNTIGYLAEAACASPRPRGDLGQGVGEASHPLEQRRHRARLRARQAHRGRGAVEPGADSHMEGTPNKWVKGGSPDRPA